MLFFFQAEDGIRDGRVTGVQTCALPISLRLGRRVNGSTPRMRSGRTGVVLCAGCTARWLISSAWGGFRVDYPSPTLAEVQGQVCARHPDLGTTGLPRVRCRRPAVSP